MIASARRPASCVCKLPSGSCLAAQRCRTTALLRLPNDTLANIRYERTRCFSSEYVKPSEAIINHACHVSGRVLPARRPPSVVALPHIPFPNRRRVGYGLLRTGPPHAQPDAAAVNQTAPSRPCFALCWVPFAEMRRNAGFMPAHKSWLGACGRELPRSRLSGVDPLVSVPQLGQRPIVSSSERHVGAASDAVERLDNGRNYRGHESPTATVRGVTELSISGPRDGRDHYQEGLLQPGSRQRWTAS